MIDIAAPVPSEMAACAPGAPAECAVCGDVALPARVLEIRSGQRLATVALLAGKSADTYTPLDTVLETALDLVDGIAVGDLVLVHQGFVISRVGVA